MTDHFAAERIKELERQVDMQVLEIKRLSKFERNVIELLDKRSEYYFKTASRHRKEHNEIGYMHYISKVDALDEFRTKLLLKHVVDSEKH